MVLNTEWSQVEVIELINDGNGFGFILVGGRSTGVVIKALAPGGVAERDGRLQCGDHLLQIGEVNLRGFSSEQVATVLRQTGVQVRLVVARPVEPTANDSQMMTCHAPIIPTKLLSDPEELSRHLYRNSALSISAVSISDSHLLTTDTELADFPLPPIPKAVLARTVRTNPKDLDIITFSIVSSPQTEPLLPQDAAAFMYSPVDQKETMISDSRETETYEVELRKNVYGLGITVAGYVCEEEDLSGVFVKSIIEGSAAEMSGKIQINDRIVAVDGKTLAGVTNHQAVEILRNTEIEVHLTLERFLRGRKFEHLLIALTELKGESQVQGYIASSPSLATLSWMPLKSDSISICTEGDAINTMDVYKLSSIETVDSNLIQMLQQSDNSRVEDIDCKQKNCSKEKTVYVNGNGSDLDNGNDLEHNRESANVKGIKSTVINPRLESLKFAWKSEFPESQIIIAEINKLSGLGISLEGTVDVECGIEKRPHHYIRSILEDGPVGRQGILKPGDELLQVNEYKLQGLKHIEVVKILKELPSYVKLVCVRGPCAPSVINTSQNPEAFETRSLLPGGHQSLQNLLTKAQSESSIYTSSTATITDQQRSKSLENVSGFALWSTDITTIELEKTDHGFGFSILDYQDPLDSEGSVIVIRGLIPGGSAETSNEIYPGDRLISVGEHDLHGLDLNEAVEILKAMPMGINTLGICRPLSTSDSNTNSPLGDRDSLST